ncbi:MAG: hypothetical protein FJW39_19010 [Acidobacteria bacterium]|nr:hypothetical protein [Acidobacteriota bacterium]
MDQLSGFWRLAPERVVRWVMQPLIGACIVGIIYWSWNTAAVLRTWKRTPGVITGTAEETAVEVTVGDLSDGTRIQVPVHPGHLYSNWTYVTVLENPAKPGERRITHWLAFADLWQPVLWYAAWAGVLLAARSMLRRAHHGCVLNWGENGWVPAQSPYIAPAPEVAGLREPGTAWIAGMAFGAILGIPLASGLFRTAAGPLAVIMGGGGLLLMGFLAWSAAEDRTREVRVDSEGMEDRSIWRIRRTEWKVIREVKLVDRRNEDGKNRRSKSKGPPLMAWRFADAGGRGVFYLPERMEPKEKLRAIVRIGQAKASGGGV